MTKTVRRTGTVIGVYVLLAGVCALLYHQLPQGFLPTEDRSQLQVLIQLPAGATQARTLGVVTRVEDILHRQQAIADVTSVVGWSFAGSGQNVAISFVELKDWTKRTMDVRQVRDALNDAFAKILDGNVQAQLPSSVPGLGRSDGFVFRLEDRGGIGMPALVAGARATGRAGESGTPC